MTVHRTIMPTYIKEKYWRKMTWEQQENLCKYKNVILIDPIPSKKQKVLDILNKVDFTTKEGAKNWEKGFDKFEKTWEKIDDALDQLDKGLAKMGNEKNTSQTTKKNKKKKTSDPLDFNLWD